MGKNQILRHGDQTIRVQRLAGTTEADPSGGTAHVAGDYVAHADWGGSASLAVATRSTDRRGNFTVTAGSSPNANPTVILTFKDGAYEEAPRVVCCRGGGTAADLALPFVVSATTTAATFTLIGTPTEGRTYTCTFIVEG